MFVTGAGLGLTKLTDRAYAYLQQDKGLGWSNAGLIAGTDESLLVDTLFDLSLTRRMLDEISRRVGKPIRRLVNTHHNGDHCWGNQLVEGADIIAHRSFRAELAKMPPEMTQALLRLPPDSSPGIALLQEALAPFDFSGIRLTPPSLVFEGRLTVYLDGREIEIFHVGPAHTSTDVMVFFPEDKILYAGDIVFRLCTPIGWEGTFENWISALERIEALAPEVVVPGHGPLCGVEGAREMRAYLTYVRREARTCYERGLSVPEAARLIDPGPYAGWTEPERIVFSVARAYREFRGEPHDAPVDFLEMANWMADLRKSGQARRG